MKKISAALFAISYLASSLATASAANAKESKKRKANKAEKMESLMFDEVKTTKSAAEEVSATSENKFNTLGEYAEAKLDQIKLLTTLDKSKSGTKGHLLGLNVLKSSVSFHEIATNSSWTTPRVFDGNSNSAAGVGVAYKYAFNYNNIFFAPGVFFDYNNLETGGNSGRDTLHRMAIKKRYGVSADLGYDVTDRIAPYITGGLSEVRYQAENWRTVSGVTTSALKTDTVSDWYYGAGLKIKLSDSFSLVTEYNTQRFDAKTRVAVTNTNYHGTYKTRLVTWKFGVFYNF